MSTNDGGAQVTRLKWFAANKGFGFVHVTEHNTDAFLHSTTLKQAGYDDLPPGSTIHCTIGSGPKGQQVLEIHQVDVSTAEPEEKPRHVSNDYDAEGPVEGEIKFFDTGKGFGFVVIPSLNCDVFLPGKLCQPSWQLQPGTKLSLTYRQGERGLIAASVDLINP